MHYKKANYYYYTLASYGNCEKKTEKNRKTKKLMVILNDMNSISIAFIFFGLVNRLLFCYLDNKVNIKMNFLDRKNAVKKVKLLPKH